MLVPTPHRTTHARGHSPPLSADQGCCKARDVMISRKTIETFWGHPEPATQVLRPESARSRVFAARAAVPTSVAGGRCRRGRRDVRACVQQLRGRGDGLAVGGQPVLVPDRTRPPPRRQGRRLGRRLGRRQGRRQGRRPGRGPGRRQLAGGRRQEAIGRRQDAGGRRQWRRQTAHGRNLHPQHNSMGDLYEVAC